MKLEGKSPDKCRTFNNNWGDLLLTEIENFKVANGKVAIWFLSDSCFVIKTPDCVIYTDPYFGGAIPESGSMRMTFVPLEPNLIKKADLVLCSHEHADHCHQESLLPFYSNTKALFVGPKPAAKLMRDWNFSENRIKEVNPGNKVSFAGVDVYADYAHDPLSDGAITYIIKSGNITLFFTGDSWYFEGFLKTGNKWDIDIAFINFGNSPAGKQYYMTPSDFLRTARDLHTKKAVPMHWDIWTYSYQDPIILNDLQKYDQNKVDILIMRLGDKVVYPH
jgi:L-ascorbate 6-phosphate lactonase